MPWGPSRVGQGKGRVAHLYPDGTVEQAIEIAHMRRQNLDLDEIGWRLWWRGATSGVSAGSVSSSSWPKHFDKCARAFRQAQASDEFVDGQIDQMIQARSKPRPQTDFSSGQEDLGPQRFAAVMNEIASMATGTFTTISSQQELENNERLEDERAMDVALGFKPARTDTIDGVGPILPNDYSPILQATFEPLEGVSLSQYLNRIDPEYLRSVARSLLGLLHSITEASHAFDRALAKDAFGLRRAAMLERADRNTHAGMILVWALVQQRSREKFHDLDAMAQLFLTAAIGARKFLELRNSDPSLRGPEFRRVTYKIRPGK